MSKDGDGGVGFECGSKLTYNFVRWAKQSQISRRSIWTVKSGSFFRTKHYLLLSKFF